MNRRSGVGTTRARLLPAAVGLLAGGLLLLLSAAPASAAAQPTLTISAPAPGTTFTTTSVTITGSANFTPDSLYHGAITSLTVTASLEGQTVGSCQNSTCGPTSGFSLALSGLDYNGPYSVAATDTSSESLILNGLGTQNGSNSASTRFEVSVKPAAPKSVTTTVNSDGTVTLSWDRNTEPDLIGYFVTGGSVGSKGAFVKQPSGSTVSWTDTGTTAGGPFDYIVTAYRNGADGKDTDPLYTSSGVVAASVPIPTPVTTAGGSTSVPGTTTTTVLSQPALPNLSSFLAQAATAGALNSKPPVVVVPPVRLAIPQPAPARAQLPAGPPNTYDPTLPFGNASTKTGANGAPQVALPASSSSGHGQPLLISVAGGMLLCVCGLALRNANRRNGPTTLEPLNTGDGDGGGGAPASPVVIPASAAAKAAARSAAMMRRPPSSVSDTVLVPDAPYAPVPAPTYEPVAAAGPFPAPSPEKAVGSKPDLVAGAEPESAPDRGALAFSAAAARAGRDFGTTLGLSPAVNEAVDYFRLLKPPSREDEPTPTG